MVDEGERRWPYAVHVVRILEIAFLVLAVGLCLVQAQEPGVPASAEPAVPQTVFEPESQGAPAKTQTHVAVFLLGTSPMDESLKVGGAGVSHPELRPSFGGGVKVGAFPTIGKGFFGVEGELFGFGGRLRAPTTGFSMADASLVAVNSMANVLVRYPGSVFQPYLGVGGGVSVGFIDVTSIQSGFVGVTGESAEATLAFQLIGGLRAYVSERVYLFGEYKYFGAKYQWEAEGIGNSEVSFSFRTHIVAVGLGVSF